MSPVPKGAWGWILPMPDRDRPEANRAVQQGVVQAVCPVGSLAVHPGAIRRQATPRPILGPAKNGVYR